MNTIEKLHRAILNHSELSKAEFIDIANHGADAGWGNFIYTAECCEFYDANEADIYDLLNEEAESMGYDNVEVMISGFNRSDMLSWPEGRKNLLAWFALEEVARAIERGQLKMDDDEEAA